MADGLMLATEKVVSELISNFKGLEAREVIIASSGEYGAADYNGEPIRELWCRNKVSWNPGASSLLLRKRCEVCGRAAYDVLGIEEPPHEEKIGDRWQMVPRRPREPGAGVILPSSVVRGDDFFDYGNNFHMCVQRAKDFIEERGWTNISFLEYGEIVDR